MCQPKEYLVKHPLLHFCLEISTGFERETEGKAIKILHNAILFDQVEGCMNIAVIEFGQGNRQFLNMKFSNLKRSLSNLHNIESTSLHLPGNNIERMIGSPFAERDTAAVPLA